MPLLQLYANSLNADGRDVWHPLRNRPCKPSNHRCARLVEHLGQSCALDFANCACPTLCTRRGYRFRRTCCADSDRRRYPRYGRRHGFATARIDRTNRAISRSTRRIRLPAMRLRIQAD